MMNETRTCRDIMRILAINCGDNNIILGANPWTVAGYPFPFGGVTLEQTLAGVLGWALLRKGQHARWAQIQSSKLHFGIRIR